LPKKGPGRTKNGSFVLSEIKVTATQKDSTEPAYLVKLAAARADVEQKDFPVSKSIDGKSDTGWAVDAEGKTLNQTHTATFEFDHPLSFTNGTRFVVELDHQFGAQQTIGRLRISFGVPIADDRPLEIRRKEALEKKFAGWLAN